MSVRVRIPTPLRPYTGGRAAVSLSGETVHTVLEALIAEAPELRPHLLAEDGSLRSFVNVYVNGEDVRARSGLETRLSDGDDVAIVPAIAGGAARLDRAFFVTGRLGWHAQRKQENAWPRGGARRRRRRVGGCSSSTTP